MARAKFWQILALAATSCATLKNDKTVCPEYRDLRCLAGETCSLDQDRGCRVCRCDQMNDLEDKREAPDTALPPPGR